MFFIWSALYHRFHSVIILAGLEVSIVYFIFRIIYIYIYIYIHLIIQCRDSLQQAKKEEKTKGKYYGNHHVAINNNYTTAENKTKGYK